MKRIRLVALLLLLATLLCACKEKAYDIVLYSYTWDDIMQSGTAFRVNGLYGQSPEALSARKRAWENAGERFYSYLETDHYLFFREGLGVPFVYDKGSGNIAFACRDSLCSHVDCIWAKAGTQVYSGGDAVIFYVEDEYTIYVGDMYGENLWTLYANEGSRFSGFSCMGEYLYVLRASTVVDEDGWLKDVYQWIRIPINGGDPEPLEEDEPHSYMDRFLRGIALPEDAYPVAVYGEWLYFTRMLGEWEPDKPRTLCRLSVYDASVQEPLFEYTGDTALLFSDETMYFLEKTPYSRSYEFGLYYEWKLYTADLQGKNKTLRMTFETDDIPDRIENLRIDGNLLYLRYCTYRDFPNEFCPAGATGEIRTMLVDLSDNRRILFGKEKGGAE